MTDSDIYLTILEVAAMLRRTQYTIRKYIRDRKLKAVRIEGKYLILKSDISKFLSERNELV